MKQKSTAAKSSKIGKPTTHDDYLAAVSWEKRAALEKLRKAIKAAAPRAEECISYQLPGISPEWKIPCRIRSGREPLRVLSWVRDHQSHERAERLRHQQGHNSVSGQ